ncbi:hypothetical protein [Vibrio sp. H11]|uniref:hypothetical protein n=1 Tax=Vibrio sp. H11 TaxID=2565928 RepID=UPI0010A60133|nr:hypothetical protein [Vibrio sp. H11]
MTTDKQREANKRRQQRSRQRKKAAGNKLLRVELADVEQERLNTLLSGRAPGRTPYDAGEYVALLIDRDWKRYQAQLAQLANTPCEKCRTTLPGGCGGLFAGEAECLLHIKNPVCKELML